MEVRKPRVMQSRVFPGMSAPDTRTEGALDEASGSLPQKME